MLKKITIVILVIFSLTVLIKISYSMTVSIKPVGEFNALKNISQSISAYLIIVFYMLQFLMAVLIWKNKVWAHFISVFLLLLSIPLFNVNGYINWLLFSISPGATVGLFTEVLPVIIVILVVICLLQYFKIKKALKINSEPNNK